MVTPELREELINHIRSNAEEKDITIDTFNAFINHAHVLLLLKNDQTISKVAQLLKGESSHWVNDKQLVPFKFEWQDEYIAVSVSESAVEVVRKYIHNQAEHHEKDALEEQYEEFLKTYVI